LCPCLRKLLVGHLLDGLKRQRLLQPLDGLLGLAEDPAHQCLVRPRPLGRGVCVERVMGELLPVTGLQLQLARQGGTPARMCVSANSSRSPSPSRPSSGFSRCRCFQSRRSFVEPAPAARSIAKVSGESSTSVPVDGPTQKSAPRARVKLRRRSIARPTQCL